MDLSALKGIVTMGSPLDKRACIYFQSILTPNIFNGYGTTESFWNSFLRPYDLPDMAGSAGRACTDDEVLLVKTYEDRKAEPWELVAQDNEEVGEIIIKSPAKSAYCYYNNPSETEKRFYNGFLYTGDLGTWDENQYIHVVGRKDDMIISAGENIYPVQIEEVLQQNPRVSDCIVTKRPGQDPGRGGSGLPDPCRRHPHRAGHAPLLRWPPHALHLQVPQVLSFCQGASLQRHRQKASLPDQRTGTA